MFYFLYKKAVFEVNPETGLTLLEIADGVKMEEILMATGCTFEVSPDLKAMGQIGVNS